MLFHNLFFFPLSDNSERVSMSFTYNIIVFHVALPHAFQKARDVLSVNSRVFRGFSESWKVSGRAGSTDITAVLQRWGASGGGFHLGRITSAEGNLGRSRSRKCCPGLRSSHPSSPNSSSLNTFSGTGGCGPFSQVAGDICPARWRRHCPPFTVLRERVASVSAYQHPWGDLSTSPNPLGG